jgi:hypothetical protein
MNRQGSRHWTEAIVVGDEQAKHLSFGYGIYWTKRYQELAR